MSTNICPDCKTSNHPGARFCRGCGRRLSSKPAKPIPSARAAAPLQCPKCKTQNRVGSKFCIACGFSLVAAKQQGSPAVKQTHVSVQGGISGQVIVGDNNMQVGSVYGNLVKVILPADRLEPQRRPAPVFKRPKEFSNLLDRETEVDSVIKTSKSGKSVEFYGKDGIGKTSLLKHLAYHSFVKSFPDGVVYEVILEKSPEDILQYLYEVFYTTGQALTKLTEAEIDTALQPIKALILLDDLKLDRTQVEMVIDSLPNCFFVLTTTSRILWGRKVRSSSLKGLPPDDAVTLVQDELGRSLTKKEMKDAVRLCKNLEGHPYNILQAVAQAQRDGISLADLAKQVKKPTTLRKISQSLATSFSATERRLVNIMTVMRDIPLNTGQLSALANVPGITGVLNSMQQRGLVQTHSPRYTLSGSLAATVQNSTDLTPVAQDILSYYTNWAEGCRSIGPLLAEVDPILRILSWGVGAGCWEMVGRLVRAVESALALGRRWGAWNLVLDWGLTSARSLGDKSSEAWYLHQMGTRALCLGDKKAARNLLKQALRLRESLGEKEAATATKFNLNKISKRPLPKPRRQTMRVSPFRRFALATVGVAAVLIASFAAWQFLGGAWDEPVPVAHVYTPEEEEPISEAVEVELKPSPTLRPSSTRPPTSIPATSTDVPPPATATRTSKPAPTYTPYPTFTPFPTFTAFPTFTPMPPDLIITEFVETGETEIDYDSMMFIVPVRVVIYNQGGQETSSFMVSIEYTEYDETYPVIFQTEAYGDSDPWSDMPLYPGESVIFDGVVLLDAWLEGSTITLRAIADSCGVYDPPGCWVQELDETNNTAEIPDALMW